MSYVEELKANYKEAHRRLWSVSCPSREDAAPEPLPAPPMAYKGQADGNMWLGLDPQFLEGHSFRGKDIIKAVLAVTQVRRLDFLSHRRYAQFVEARQLACWFMRHYTDYSLPQIGRLVGGRDHSTALHGIRMVSSHQDHFESRVKQIALMLRVSLPKDIPFQ